MRVKFVRLGAESTEIDVPQGSTLADAAARAHVRLDGFTVRVSGEEILSPSDQVPTTQGTLNLVVSPKVEGGFAPVLIVA